LFVEELIVASLLIDLGTSGSRAELNLQVLQA